MNWELVGIATYVLGMLYVGYAVSKRIKTEDDYFLAGRSLGPGLATFSIFATWFGAESCIGTSGKVFRSGISGTHADPFGYGLCIILMALIFARVLWNKQITTLPDLFRSRYSPSVERVAAFIMIPSSIIWAGAQIRAFGQIIHVTTDYPVVVAITMAAAVVILYTMFGGLLADAYNDLIQGIAIMIGLVILLAVMVDKLGGVHAALATIRPQSLDFFKLEEGSWWERWEMWLVPILGSMMSQELVSRVSASRSADIAAQSAYRAAVIYILVGLMPVMIGLIGHAFHPDIQEADSIMPLLAKTHLHTFLYVIFVGALVAAILSTVDSTLLTVSALVTHNLVNPIFPNQSDRQKVLLARGGVVCSGLIAYSIAFTAESVTEMVEAASGLGGPIILVLVCFALFTKLGDHLSAMVAMIMSVATWFVGNYVYPLEAPVITTVIVCFLSYLAMVPWAKKTPQSLPGPQGS